MNMVAFEMDCKHGESMMSSEPPSHTFPSLDKSDTRLMIFVLECSNDSSFGSIVMKFPTLPPLFWVYGILSGCLNLFRI